MKPLSRRHFLQSLAVAVPATAAWRAWATEESLPPIRQITRGPKFHWRGYYDKLLFDPTDRFIVANEVDFEGRSPVAEDSIRVGMVDAQDNDKWIELGSSRAWNWQQGCMLQWVPGTESEVAWNDREGDRFVSRILDVKSGRKRTLPHPLTPLLAPLRSPSEKQFIIDSVQFRSNATEPQRNGGTRSVASAGLGWRPRRSVALQAARQIYAFVYDLTRKEPNVGQVCNLPGFN